MYERKLYSTEDRDAREERRPTDSSKKSGIQFHIKRGTLIAAKCLPRRQFEGVRF